MKVKETTRQTVFGSFVLHFGAIVIFFSADGVCDHLLYDLISEYDDSAETGSELTQEYIEQAAKVTFLNVALLSLLCTVIDGIRRRIIGETPGEKNCEGGGADDEGGLFRENPVAPQRG